MRYLTTVPAALVLAAVLGMAPAWGQTASAPSDQYEPQVGQAGKDVVWVPTPDVVVERMLDVAGVTADDMVIDLGSGDGRNVIAAARRGARARGVEYNEDLVELSRRRAAEAGVADRAEFVRGDMYEADISDATVMALFLLSSNLERLKDKFLALRPGTRIVSNTFSIPDWEPDAREEVDEGCSTWCSVLLYIVPAQVGGTWRLGDSTLTFVQNHQMLTGSLTRGSEYLQIIGGRLRGTELEFNAGGVRYTGRLESDGRLQGTTANGERWVATRVQQ